MELNKLRNNIDKVDARILALLKKRLEIVESIGKYKKKNNLKIVDKKREKEIIDSKKLLAKKLNFDEKYVEDLFKRIIKESYKIEKKSK